MRLKKPALFISCCFCLSRDEPMRYWGSSITERFPLVTPAVQVRSLYYPKVYLGDAYILALIGLVFLDFLLFLDLLVLFASIVSTTSEFSLLTLEDRFCFLMVFCLANLLFLEAFGDPSSTNSTPPFLVACLPNLPGP